jgi:prepilin signal peptidase PulO-like enzyme (type II secretory pathway)
MNKQELWPKEGKMKKIVIILAIVIASALLIVLFEEKTTLKVTKRIPFVIALACVAVWFYQPAKKEKL